MKKEKLKTILSQHYSKDGIKSILCGRMKPSYEVMCTLNEKHKIPFTAWKNIKSYVSNNTEINSNITRL